MFIIIMFRFFIKKKQLINIQQRKKNYRINKFNKEIEMEKRTEKNGCRDRLEKIKIEGKTQNLL